MPALSSERREALVKLVKSEAEKAKVAVRNIRRDIISDLKSELKNKLISEDDLRRAEAQIQKVTDSMTHEIDNRIAEKEKEILTV
jgi:ribosome recycling factor